MARTTSTLVTNILVDVESDVGLDQFITVANRIVTKQCTDSTFTTAELEYIERYLAAHLYTVSRPIAVHEGIAGGPSETKQHSENLGFDSSHFGQTAMRLDWSGKLASLNNRIKKGLRSSVSLTWLGEENPASTELDDVLGL